MASVCACTYNSYVTRTKYKEYKCMCDNNTLMNTKAITSMHVGLTHFLIFDTYDLNRYF